MADNVRRYTIPEVPISINRFIGRDNKWAYYAEKTRWRELCTVYCRPRPDHPPEFAHLKIQFFFPNQRRHDSDNYQKALLDGLVHSGVIYDDDFDHVSVMVSGGYDKENRRTEITVTEVER